MSEQWAPVVGWEGLYAVSTLGRVYSERSGKLLAAVKHKSHLRVSLQRNGSRSDLLIHRLVLEAFAGPCPPGMDACHNNDIGDDNRIENLRWDTPSENALDRVRNGNHWAANMIECKYGHKLTPENTYVYQRKDRNMTSERRCRECATRRRKAMVLP